MKILVIDDNIIHLNAALAQLSAEHDVTTAQTYDEAQSKLGGSRINGVSPRSTHLYEMVLVDLLMPASSQQCGAMSPHAGKEMPVGIFLGLLAAKNGAKFVGLLTDSDHHSHPASACFDSFNVNGGETCPDRFTVAGAQFVLSNDRNAIKMFHKDDLSKELEFGKNHQLNDPDHVCTKDWRMLLERLLSKELTNSFESSAPANVVNALYQMPYDGWDIDGAELLAIYKAAIDNCVAEQSLPRVRVANEEKSRLEQFAQWLDKSKNRRFYEGSMDKVNAMAQKARFLQEQLDRHYCSDPAEVAAEEARVAKMRSDEEKACMIFVVKIVGAGLVLASVVTAAYHFLF